MLALLLLLTTASGQDRQDLRDGLREIGGGEAIHAVSDDGDTAELLTALVGNSPGLRLSDGASCRVTVLEGSKDNWLLRGTGCAMDVVVTGLRPRPPAPVELERSLRWHGHRTSVVVLGGFASLATTAVTGAALQNTTVVAPVALGSGAVVGMTLPWLAVPPRDRLRAIRFSLVGTPLMLASAIGVTYVSSQLPQQSSLALFGLVAVPIWFLGPPMMSALAVRRDSFPAPERVATRWDSPDSLQAYLDSRCGLDVTVTPSEVRIDLAPADGTRLDEVRACTAAWTTWGPESWRWTEDESGAALVHAGR